MKWMWRVDGVVCALVVGMTIVQSTAMRAKSLPGPVIEAAKQLASLLGASPPVAAGGADAEAQTRLQSDVNRMAYLASLLAGELASGKGREQTASIYSELERVGLRVRAQSRAAGVQPSPEDAKTYERLMQTLQAWYSGAAQPKAAAGGAPAKPK